MDDDSTSSSRTYTVRQKPPRQPGLRLVLARGILFLAVVAAFLVVLHAFGSTGGDAAAAVHPETRSPEPWHEYFSFTAILVIGCLLLGSAFFSSSETAFFSIQKPHLRVLRSQSRVTSRLVVRLLDKPGRLLTTILVGNMLVNAILGVVVGPRAKNFFEGGLLWSPAGAYFAAIVSCTAVLVLFGEIFPKVFAVGAGEAYARVVAAPLVLVDRALWPLCRVFLRITEFMFRITRFHELHAAPYITDEELKSFLANGEPEDAAEEEGREMIKRILDFHDVMLKEILVPRPDVLALPQTATVREALDLFRQHEFSRIPLYQDDLDHVTGLLYAKDLLPSLRRGQMDSSVGTLAREPHFVPETMSVQDFVKTAQRLRTHLAIVVDEYGGTEGIVTLDDAIEQVVGDIVEENEVEESEYEVLGDDLYLIQGNMSLETLAELTGVPVDHEEHETVAGFLMDASEKIPEVGDQISHGAMLFTVEAVEGKRVAMVRLQLVPQDNEEVSPT